MPDLRGFKYALLSAFFLIFLFPKDCFASFSFTISEIQPTEVISKEQEVTVKLDIKGLPSESYFRVAWKKGDDSGSYFGYIKDNNNQWQKIETLSSDNCSKYFKVTATGDGQISLTTKIGAEENLESGNFILKAHRFTSGCSSTASTNTQTVNLQLTTINETVFPSPSIHALATCKINEAKDSNGNVLTSVKIYLDNVYTHHYAPQTLTFCDDCQDGKLGSHTIMLEKSNYQNWTETKDFNSGNSFEFNPQLVLLAASAQPLPSIKPSPIPSVISSSVLPTPEIKLTVQKESTKSVEINLLSPLPSTQSSVLGEKTPEESSKPILIPAIFSSAGLALMGLAYMRRK